MPIPGASMPNRGPKACSTCARAKSRCIPGPVDQEKCERCHRLRKPCSSQTPAPPRKRKQPKTTRVAELERRLEDLTARIESAQRLGPAAPSPPDSDHYAPPSRPPDSEHYALPSRPVGGASADPAENPLPPRNLSGTQVPLPTFGGDRWVSPLGHIFPNQSIFESEARPSGPAGPANSLAVPSGLPSAQTTTATSASISPSPAAQQPCSQPYQPERNCPWLQGDEAEAFLETYRTRMAHLFPFVIVPPHLSSSQLREQRPFLWKAIMVEACLFDGARQVALGNELLREISEAAFVRPQKSIDLLHGLQMLIAWYHYNINSFQMVNLLFLARSITSSLGSVDSKEQSDNGEYTSKSLEQMRAFAGTYYLVTITFTTNKRPDALMNNVNASYLATCCRALHTQMEQPTDELVVHLVRAQQLNQTITQAFARRNAGSNEGRIPQAAFVKALKDRIQTFTATLPPHIRADQSLTSHLQIAEILIYENSVEELSRCPFAGGSCEQAPFPTASALTASEPDPERVELLWQCARVVRTVMTGRFSRNIEDYPRFMCLSSFDITYAFVTMLKLVTLQVPGWDLARVRAELPTEDLISRLIERMEYVAERRRRKKAGGVINGQEDEPEDPYTKLARKARNLRDLLHVNGFDNGYAASQIVRVCDPAPMTVVDATQDLMQDLGGGLWQDVPNGTFAWDSFFAGEAMDWAAVLNDYSMTS